MATMTELTEAMARAKAKRVHAEHNRKVVLCAEINRLDAAWTGAKDPSEAKLDRMARDSKEYRDAINQLSDAVYEDEALWGQREIALQKLLCDGSRDVPSVN